jgi:hypothetical protein
MKKRLIGGALFVAFSLCGISYADDDGLSWRVMSHNPSTHVWIITQDGTWQGKNGTMQVTAVCAGTSRIVNRQKIITKRPDACNLMVGSKITPSYNRPSFLKGGDGDFLDLYFPSDDLLIISKGGTRSSPEFTQFFNVLETKMIWK